ncbi:MAG: NAD-dependent epimerase/dehydratase family protein [Smithellaceae bacterium]
MDEKRVGILGATSLVGQCLLPLLKQNGWKVRAFSRHPMSSDNPDIQWTQLPSSIDAHRDPASESDKIDFWICVAPIWVLPDYFPMLEQCGARRVIAFSSTSRFTKGDSTDADEKITALKLKHAEDRLQSWGKDKSIDWVVLRPTLIYGLGQDKNIYEIVRLIRRFGFFPLLGQANGLRQPVHAEDLAAACLSALEKTDIVNWAYNLSGGETLRYREMINRVFAALGRRPRLIYVPGLFFRLAAAILRLFPRYRHWNMSMAERMNTDLVFDHADAARDLNFQPRKFQPSSKDLPK